MSRFIGLFLQSALLKINWYCAYCIFQFNNINENMESLINLKKDLERFEKLIWLEIESIGLNLLSVLFFSGSDIHRCCFNAINRLLRRKVQAKRKRPEGSSNSEKLTMNDLQASLSEIHPLSQNWRKKYQLWKNDQTLTE